MRRWLAVVVSVVAILGLMAPAADAQAPKVTINGLVDQVLSWSRNISHSDGFNYDKTDTEWYGRTRVRPDITAEVGTTKFVLGIEIDAAYGQVGNADSGAPQRFGTRGGFDQNTDVPDLFEVKWAYTEFDIPWVSGARFRLGAQPWAQTYKVGVLTTGDFAGWHLMWGITPAIRLHATYAKIEEEAEPSILGAGAIGEDYAIVTSVEVTPFKGLNLRPLYALLHADSRTGAARFGRGGVANSAVFFPLGNIEERHTLGIDARLRLGPVSVDPTFFYQFGQRDVTCAAAIAFVCGAGTTEQDISAFLLDLRAGFQLGPLLLEGAFIYTSGNEASDTTSDDLNYFQPISTDTGFYSGWANIFALGVDYFNILYAGAAGLNPGAAIGYDKYGLIRIGGRATYALTPAFSLYTNILASWTAEDVDTTATFAGASGLTPRTGSGDESYLGTEVNLGMTWRMAPNLVFDLVGGYMFAGDALAWGRGAGAVLPVAGGNHDPEDVKTIVARWRFTF
jgi:hypothetical protein